MSFSSMPRYPGEPEDKPCEADGTAEQGKADEAAAVAAFRYWRRVMMAGWLSVLPLGALGFLACPCGLVAVVPGVIAFAIGSGHVNRFRCPRCGRTFTWSWAWRNAFTDNCVHCGHSISA